MRGKLQRFSTYCAVLLSICLLFSNQMVARAEFTACDQRAVLLSRPNYDPCAASCASAGGVSTVVLTGSDNAQKVFNFFVGKGLSAEQAAGITGNGETESGLNPTNAGNPAFSGIFQWDNASRWPRLVADATQKGKDPNALETQLDYAFQEATDRGNIDGIKQYSQVDLAAWYWGRFFEVAIIGGSTSTTPLTNVQDLDKRIKNAQDVLQLYGASAQTGTTNAANGAVSSACGSASGGSVVGCNFGAGTGPFANTNTTVYPRVDEMCQRAQKLTDRNSPEFQDACGDSPGTGSNLCAGACESAAEYTWLGTRYQYASAMADWNAQQASGHAHPGDRDPPVGALLFYNTSAFGHVAVYLGDNKLLSTDIDGRGYIYIVNADRMESAGWHAPYLGWSDPFFKGEVQ